jgi:hypothetical protein
MKSLIPSHELSTQMGQRRSKSADRPIGRELMITVRALIALVVLGAALGVASPARAQGGALNAAKSQALAWASGRTQWSQTEIGFWTERLQSVSRSLTKDLTVGDEESARARAKLENSILKIDLASSNPNTPLEVRGELVSLKSEVATLLPQIAAGWVAYREAVTAATLHRPNVNIAAHQKFLAELATYTVRVQAASTMTAFSAVPRPTLAVISPAPQVPSDPLRQWKMTVEKLYEQLKKLEKQGRVDAAEGICMLPDAGDDHHDDAHDHPVGHHDTCGCEQGVLTVHGQRVRLPNPTRVISIDTRMSDIVDDLGDDEVLEIGHDAVLTFDVANERRIRAIVVYGTLAFATDRNTTLLVGDLVVAPPGSLIVGTEEAPIEDAYKAEITIADYPLDRLNDPYRLGRGIIALGTVEMNGRKVTTPGIAPVNSPKAGDTSILLSELPAQHGWRVGDVIVLADTRQLAKVNNKAYLSQTEYATITAMTGNRIQLAKSLSYDHPGIMLPDITGRLSISRQIEVMNTTRNVVVSSESPSGTRGHTLFTDGAKVNIRYTTFKDLGRTIAGDLDSTECDTQGRMRNDGFNQVGRYAFHAHHLRGPNNFTNAGYQFQLVGATFEGSLRWAAAIHNTSFGLIKDNVFHRNPGTALAFEEGGEAYNDVIRNWFVGTAPGDETVPETMLSRGGRTRDSETGKLSFHGSIAIWDSPLNAVKDNRIYGHFGVGYELNEYYEKSIKTPKFRGADLHDSNSWINWGARRNDANNRTAAAPVAEKRDNLIVGSLLAFYEAWPRATASRAAYAEVPSVFERFILANVQEGVHAYHTSNSEYRDFVMVNDSKVANGYSGGSRYTTAFNLANPSYESANMRIVSENANAVVARSEGTADADGVYAGTFIANFHIGVDCARNSDLFGVSGSSPENTTTIVGGKWQNYVNFKINAATDQTARVATIADVDLLTPVDMKQIPSFPQSPLNVLMDFNFLSGGNYTNVLTRDRVFINRWSIDGASAPDFRVYYLQQNPDFIVPLSSDIVPRVRGAIEPNLTNEQHRLKYGTTIADSLAPCGRSGLSCDALRLKGAQWGIYGLVEDQG